MYIQLIEGEFKSNDALDLITQMIQVKIKFHENKISKSEIEEDIKAREAKIKRLQKDLFELRNDIGSNLNAVKLDGVIKIG
ncbi:MAG: hypothetical protein PSX81_12410 [bacterium]|nr:hypothetical protein [bacterium]